MTDALVLAPLVVGAVLVVSGVTKLRRPDALVDSAADLGVPGALARPEVLRLVPYAEVVLGLAVVLVPGPAAYVPAVLGALLLLAYTALVGRVVLSGAEASCACFGDSEPVGPRTLVRNVVLLLVAVLAVVAVAGGSPLGRLADLGSAGWWWLGGAALLAVVVLVSVPRGGVVEAGAHGIPYLPLTLADGTPTTLPELASLRAQLLVHLSDTCDRCRRVSAVIADWPALVPDIDVRVLTKEPVGAALPASWPNVVHDPDERISTVLGLPRPSAVLLGADALIAGGPVHGPSAVLELFEEIRDQLDGPRYAR